MARGLIGPQTEFELQPCVHEALQAMLAELRTAKPIVPCDFVSTAPEAELFTDASTKGWGTVLSVAGKVAAYGALWSADTDEHINVLETRAVELAVRHFQRSLAGKRVRVAVDNVTAERSVYCQRARSDQVAAAAAAATAALTEVTGSWIIARIATDVNPADEPSRDQAVDVQKAILATGHTTVPAAGFRANETLWRVC